MTIMTKINLERFLEKAIEEIGRENLIELIEV